MDIASEDCPTNEPAPETSVCERSGSRFPFAPKPDDIALLIEVADALDYDVSINGGLYAMAGIIEYGVPDPGGRRSHRNPPEGKYRSIPAYDGHEDVASLAEANPAFRIGEVFPPK
ncbi:MAG TPA: hypothetical protein VKU19_29510 [Bryobacteraceae bacterium]|nr:hypothetical protein [Bryobacteraceae bacterium]